MSRPVKGRLEPPGVRATSRVPRSRWRFCSDVVFRYGASYAYRDARPRRRCDGYLMSGSKDGRDAVTRICRTGASPRSRERHSVCCGRSFRGVRRSKTDGDPLNREQCGRTSRWHRSIQRLSCGPFGISAGGRAFLAAAERRLRIADARSFRGGGRLQDRTRAVRRPEPSG